MLKIFSANSYESLQAQLRFHLEADLRKASVFSGVKVICGTPSVEARLKQDLAGQWGICSGIDFQGQASWLQFYLGCGVNASNQSVDYLWAVYQSLTPDFIENHPRLKDFFANDTGLPADVVRFDFAKRVSNVFAHYVNARIDWMTAWLTPEIADSRIVDELQSLEAYPDYAWQKALFLKVCQIDRDRAQQIKVFYDDETLKSRLDREEPASIHFFMPREFMPMAMKVFRLLDGLNRDVYLYVFNPSEAIRTDTNLLTFIQRNAEPTSAFIRSFDSAFAWEKLSNVPVSQSLLTQAQEAIRLNDKTLLPSHFSNDDQSIRIVKGPTATREIENAVDLIHTLVGRSDSQYKASDILVVAPDMDKLAPIVDATLQALPQEHRIAYRISGLTRHDDMMSASSFLGLMKLVTGNVSLADFETWLELPLVTQTLGLSLTDLSVLQDWLVQAGFREGLTETHLRQIHNLPDDVKDHQSFDGSLDRALERLSWGFVMEDSDTAIVSDVLPVTVGQAYRFKTVHSQFNLLKTLLVLAEKLKEVQLNYVQMAGKQFSIEDLDGWVNGLVETFFDKKSLKDSIFVIHEATRQMRRSLEPFAETIGLTPTVYVRALEDCFSEQKASNNLSGEVTFANLSGFRRLPYKVIIALGLNEDSNFPGKQTFDEFNLLQVAPRDGDVNARSEKRNVFLDLVLSAREKLILSYESGVNEKAQKQPSPVIGDLLELLNSNTAIPISKWGDALTVRLALTNTSPKNFQTDALKYWQSADDRLLEAIKERGSLESEKPCSKTYEGGLSTELFPDRTLTVTDVLTYMKDPERWVMKKLGIFTFESEPFNEVPVKADESALAKSNLRKKWTKLFEAGETVESILVRQAFDPLMGAIEHRTCYFEDELSTLYSLWSQRPTTPKTYSVCINLPKGGFFERVVATNEVLYEMGDEDGSSLILLASDLSGTASMMGRIRQCILNAGGLPASLICFPKDKAKVHQKVLVPAFEAESALSHVNDMVKLMEGTLVDLAAHGAKPYQSHNDKLEHHDLSFLWRGVENLKSRYQALDELKKDFEVSAPKKANTRGKKTVKGAKQ